MKLAFADFTPKIHLSKSGVKLAFTDFTPTARCHTRLYPQGLVRLASNDLVAELLTLDNHFTVQLLVTPLTVSLTPGSTTLARTPAGTVHV